MVILYKFLPETSTYIEYQGPIININLFLHILSDVDFVRFYNIAQTFVLFVFRRNGRTGFDRLQLPNGDVGVFGSWGCVNGRLSGHNYEWPIYCSGLVAVAAAKLQLYGNNSKTRNANVIIVLDGYRNQQWF